MNDTVVVGLPDLRRKNFESWFTSLFLKYDKIQFSNRYETQTATKEFFGSVSETIKEIMSMNWNKIDGGGGQYKTLELFDSIKWNDKQYNRLVEDHAIAVHLLETKISEYDSLTSLSLKRNFQSTLPFSRDTQLKLEKVILTSNEDSRYNNPIDKFLECEFKATDMVSFIDEHTDTVYPLIEREACPLNLVKHAYSRAKEKNTANVYFAILENPSAEVKLRDIRFEIMTTFNYEVMSLCVKTQQKERYYEAVKKCAEQHGFVLKVEEA
jgi:hypothetical protein